MSEKKVTPPSGPTIKPEVGRIVENSNNERNRTIAAGLLNDIKSNINNQTKQPTQTPTKKGK